MPIQTITIDGVSKELDLPDDVTPEEMDMIVNAEFGGSDSAVPAGTNFENQDEVRRQELHELNVQKQQLDIQKKSNDLNLSSQEGQGNQPLPLSPQMAMMPNPQEQVQNEFQPQPLDTDMSLGNENNVSPSLINESFTSSGQLQGQNLENNNFNAPPEPESFPSIGSQEYYETIMDLQGESGFTGGVKSFFTKEQMFPAMQSVFGDSNDIADTVLGTVEGSAEVKGPNGERLIQIGDKIFAPDDSLKIIGDIGMFSPAGFATAGIRKASINGLRIMAGSSFKRKAAHSTIVGVASLATAAPTSIAGEFGRELLGSKQGISTEQIIFETLAAPVGEGIAWVGMKGGRAIVDRIKNGSPNLSTKVMKFAIDDVDGALDNAVRVREARDLIAEQTGVPASSIDLPISQATMESNLLERSNFINRLGTKEGQALGAQLRELDASLYNVVTQFTNRVGGLKNRGFSEQAVQEASKKSLAEFKKVLAKTTSAAFEQAKKEGVSADITPVINKAKSLLSKRTLHGKSTSQSKTLEWALNLLKPSNIKKTVEVGTGKRKLNPITGIMEEVKRSKNIDVENYIYDDINQLHIASKVIKNRITELTPKVGKQSVEEAALLTELNSSLKKVIDDSMGGLDQANKLYMKVLRQRQFLETGPLGKVVNLKPGELEKISDTIYKPEYGVGEVSKSFKTAKAMIKNQDPEAWKGLNALQIKRSLKNIASDDSTSLLNDMRPDIPTAGQQFRALNSSLAKKKLIKEGFDNVDQVRTFDTISSMLNIGNMGRRAESITAVRQAKENMISNFSSLSPDVVHQISVAARGFFKRRQFEKYTVELGKILSSPESVWFPQLKSLANQMRAKPKNVPRLLAQMTQLLDEAIADED